jgi:hypothetical protein
LSRAINADISGDDIAEAAEEEIDGDAARGNDEREMQQRR